MKITQTDRDKIKAVRERLEQQTGIKCGSGYGYANGIEGMDAGEEPEWYLFVQSDDPNFKFPAIFEGYRVLNKGVIRAEIV